MKNILLNKLEVQDRGTERSEVAPLWLVSFCKGYFHKKAGW